MTECFPATQLRAPIRTKEQVHLAASTVASLGRMRDPRGPKHARIRSAHTIDRTRLTGLWLTVYPSTFVEIKRHGTLAKTVVRFYLNAPAHKAIFPRTELKVSKAFYLSIDDTTHEVVLTWRKGGHPVLIHPDASGYFRSGWIANELQRIGYLLDEVPTYFPLTKTSEGLIADLSVAYSKADAVAHEEDTCR